MTATAERSETFCKQVAQHKRIWTILASGGYPAPRDVDGVRTQPFWSSKEQAEEIIEHNKHYSDFKPEEITWWQFAHVWVRELKSDGLLVGLNWRGKHAPGNDLEPDEVVRQVERYLRERSWLRRLLHFGR